MCVKSPPCLSIRRRDCQVAALFVKSPPCLSSRRRVWQVAALFVKSPPCLSSCRRGCQVAVVFSSRRSVCHNSLTEIGYVNSDKSCFRFTCSIFVFEARSFLCSFRGTPESCNTDGVYDFAISGKVCFSSPAFILFFGRSVVPIV